MGWCLGLRDLYKGVLLPNFLIIIIRLVVVHVDRSDVHCIAATHAFVGDSLGAWGTPLDVCHYHVKIHTHNNDDVQQQQQEDGKIIINNNKIK